MQRKYYLKGMYLPTVGSCSMQTACAWLGTSEALVYRFFSGLSHFKETVENGPKDPHQSISGYQNR
jgi:hypothetical protein